MCERELALGCHGTVSQIGQIENRTYAENQMMVGVKERLVIEVHQD